LLHHAAQAHALVSKSESASSLGDKSLIYSTSWEGRQAGKQLQRYGVYICGMFRKFRAIFRMPKAAIPHVL